MSYSGPIYICKFEFKGATLKVKSSLGLGMFKHGFWIDGNLKYNPGGEDRFWISPHKISYIEVIRGKIEE